VVERMGDCEPRGEILVTGRRGQAYEFAEPSSVWQIFAPLPTNHESAEWLCALLHSWLASRLTVIPNIPLDPRRSRMAP
jgi:hypothetical protein